jgi:ribosomal protein S18 acetylase RimI-like enzyme
MDMLHIELTTTPTEQDAQAISQGIISYNQAVIPDLESLDAEVNFSVFVRNKQRQVVGGIRATCYWNTLHIELLWLDQDCRRQGAGRRLLRKAEHFAKKQGCENAFVETTSWQAAPFYEKHGYQHIATLPGRPRGHASHYLSKKLTPGSD